MSNSRRKAPTAPPSAFPNIEFLLEDHGDITIGGIGTVPCSATAANEDQCFAMLVRRPGESLLDLLRRLDAAIGNAYETGDCIDEINAPPR
jgi:hypothetical protein